MASAPNPAKGRRCEYVIAALIAALTLIWAAPAAHAQIPNPVDIELPDPGDVLPDPGKILPDPPPLPDPQDLPVPDLGEVLPDTGGIVPDPGDVLPDPDEIDLPGGDDPAPEPDPDKDDGSGKRNRQGKGAPPADRRGRGPGDGPSGNGRFPRATAADLAPAGAVATSGTTRGPLAKSDSGKGIGELLSPLTFPLILMLAVGAFLALQDHFDRRDPKLALGPIGLEDRRLTFE